MKHLGFAAVLLCCVATGAMAETVGVRSGEHAAFSRLVLRFDQVPEVVAGRVAGGYELRAPSEDRTYDLSRVFDMIPRERILDTVDRGAGGLFIASDCECHLEVFQLDRTYLVVDVKDGPAPEALSAFNQSLDPDPEPEIIAEEAAPGLPIVTGSDIGPRRSALPTVFGANVLQDLGIDPIAPADGPDEAADRVAGADAAPLPEEDSSTVSDLEEALLAQISRAATQGLLDADLPDVEESLEGPDIETAAPAPPPDAIINVPVKTEPEPESHFAVQTAIDRARTSTKVTRNETNDGVSCIPSKYFNITEWGTPPDEGADIGSFRANLVTAYDTSDSDGATALVRHYIYITFGAEAKALLAYYKDRIDRTDILSMMADVMDHGQSDQALNYVGQMTCGGPVALWATLAQPQLYAYQSINTDALTFEFLKLPVHLRNALGPRLVEKFIGMGDQATAATLKSAIDRVRGAPTENLGMMDATYALSEGETGTATDAYDSVIEGGDIRVPEALMERAKLAFETGEPVEEDLISLLQSVAYENRGTAREADLRALAVEAIATTKDLERTLARYDQFVADFGAENQYVPGLRENAFDVFMAEATDQFFLTETLARMDEALMLPLEKRRAMARRALDLAVPELAKSVLASAGIPEPDERLLLAEALLQQRRADVALGYLAGLNDEAALLLRAEAFEQMADHAAAAEVYGQLGLPEDQLSEAWRGGQWDAVAESGEGVTRDASALMLLGPNDALGEAETQLAETNALIENARKSRETLETLLTAFPDLENPPE